MLRSLRLALIAVLLTAAVAGCDPERPVSSDEPSGAAGAGSPGAGTPGARPPGAGTQAVVTGTVRDAAGHPVAGIMIVPISLDNPPKALPEIAILTDANGVYRWVLTPGRYAFTAQKPGIPRKEVTLRPGNTTLDFQVP